MFEPLYNKASQNIEVIKYLLDEHEKLSSVATSVSSRTEIKIFSIASSVTRLYAIYELYVETILSDYLDSIAGLIKYVDLPDGFKTEYRLGISHILSKIDQGRYNHLKHDNVVNFYHAAVSGGLTYQFVTDALIRHEQNLRLNILNNLFSRLGLNDFESWSVNHKLICDFFETDTVTKETIESQIKNFVDLRNDASHGEIDNLVNVEIMKGKCNFINVFLEVIRQFIAKSLIVEMESKGKILKLGKVTESFGQNGAFVFIAKSGISISKSDKIYILEKNSFSSQEIDSIRLDDVCHDKLDVTIDNLEVGVKCLSLINKNALLYKDI